MAKYRWADPYIQYNTQQFIPTLLSMQELAVDSVSPKDYIIIKGAKAHNLKNVTLAIPRNQLVVVTGLSGSGKSSLIIDTLFVEAQRMYIESVSAYARQFLGKMPKPAVDAIWGLSPAIAIQQQVTNTHPRSTVGTVTELCDYLNLLYARIGITHSPISGQPVKKDGIADVVDYIYQQAQGTKVWILYPMAVASADALSHQLSVARGKGLTRVVQAGQLFFIEAVIEGQETLNLCLPIYGLVDRMVVGQGDQDGKSNTAGSVQTAFFEGMGQMAVEIVGAGPVFFSDRFELDGMQFEQPSVHLFSFNTPHGACKTCQGLGQIVGIDGNKVIPNPCLSISEGAIAPWNGPIMRKWLAPLFAADMVPMDRPYQHLTSAQKALLWKGSGDFIGIDPFFHLCATKTDKIQYRVLLARYRGKTICADCKGVRVRSDVDYVKIHGHSIVDLLQMPIAQLILFFDALPLTPQALAIVHRVVVEIKNRLRYLAEVGLGYLTLSRSIVSLSSGEHQRIRLASVLGSPLFGTIYILDEPTVGLHPRDTDQLVKIMRRLQQQGNTVIVIEHEEMVMQAADTLIEIGPEAGSAGGSLIFQGTLCALLASNQTHTAHYLNGGGASLSNYRRHWHQCLRLEGAALHNLKQVTVEIPLQVLTVVTGVSGSGKSSLIKECLFPALERYFSSQFQSGERVVAAWKEVMLGGDLHAIQGVELVSQNPLGRSSRSNPATYLGIYDCIRALFVQTESARARSYQMGHFSFNAEKGQCAACHGEGQQKIEMQFMADICLPCEVCTGSRFQSAVLEIYYRGKNIAEVLSLTVDEAVVFFANAGAVYPKLKVLQEVGLGYVPLGQSAATLSGGEAQRLKLAYYLSKAVRDHMLLIFDEPTTGLHMHDVHQLLIAMHALVHQGHTVIVIEHNIDVIKNADWVIDLGPEGGAQGGYVVFTGRPEALVQVDGNHTAHYVKQKL